jgi:hypothetical protein
LRAADAVCAETDQTHRLNRRNCRNVRKLDAQSGQAAADKMAAKKLAKQKTKKNYYMLKKARLQEAAAEIRAAEIAAKNRGATANCVSAAGRKPTGSTGQAGDGPTRSDSSGVKTESVKLEAADEVSLATEIFEGGGGGGGGDNGLDFYGLERGEAELEEAEDPLVAAAFSAPPYVDHSYDSRCKTRGAVVGDCGGDSYDSRCKTKGAGRDGGKDSYDSRSKSRGAWDRGGGDSMNSDDVEMCEEFRLNEIILSLLGVRPSAPNRLVIPMIRVPRKGGAGHGNVVVTPSEAFDWSAVADGQVQRRKYIYSYHFFESY